MLKNLGCFSLLRALLKCVNFALLLTDFSQFENKCLILFVGRQLQVLLAAGDVFLLLLSVSHLYIKG